MNNGNFFVKLGKLMLAYPKTALSLIFLELLLLVSQLPRLEIDTSVERFLDPESQTIQDYDEFRNTFGRDEFFVIAITDVDVLSIAFLEKLKQLHGNLERSIDMLQSVESLANVRSIYGEDDDLIAEDLLETIPETEAELEVLKDRIRGKPLYYGRLINSAEDATAIMVKLIPYSLITKEDGSQVVHNLSDVETVRAYEQIKAVVKDYQDILPQAEFHIGGTPASGSYMSRVIQQDFGVFTSAALAMIIIILSFLFRRASGVVYPIVVMSIGILTTIALMPVLGYPMQITTSIIPSFLLAVCVGDSVHLLTSFYHSYDQGNSKRDAILHALDHTGTAILFTSLTTAAGLLTFAFSDMVPIASLGLFTAIGSILAFLITVILLPVLLWLTPLKRRKELEDGKLRQGSLALRFTEACIYLSTCHPRKVVATGLVLAAVAISIIPGMRFSQDSLEWLEDDTPVKMAIKTIERTITGSLPMEIVIDTGEEQGIYDPVFLKRLEEWTTQLEGSSLNGIKVMSVMSIADLIKETNQAFNANAVEAYRIPDSRELIAQELLLIEMDEADDLYNYTDSDMRLARVTIILPWDDAVKFAALVDELRAAYHESMGYEYNMHITGVIPIFSKMLTTMIETAAQSYLIAAIAIGFMMMLMMRGVIDGLLSMIPNLFPIVMVLAFMVLQDIPMDIFTILMGSIALGLAVDDTVHFMHGFKANYARNGGHARQAIEDTLLSTGRALMITSLVLTLGFLVFTLSALKNMDVFGTLTALCITLAFLADFLLAPALMYLRYHRETPDEEAV